MNDSIYHIPLLNLGFAFIPVIAVIAIYVRWSLNARTLVYAIARMILQLLLIGYVLIGIFSQESPWIITGILTVMLFIAGWIAIRPIAKKSSRIFWQALLSLFLGCVPTLLLVIVGVIQLKPWHDARYLIPIAGMIFANAMNALSLGTERYFSEKEKGAAYVAARNVGMNAALLPLTNSLFAVGLVSLPGMMTGQILAGISPLIAARYQIMVMCMMLGSSGLATLIMLKLQEKDSA